MGVPDRSDPADAESRKTWDRTRWGVVVPISVIVAVAILCIVVAVWTSAQRADEVALDQERRLLSRAIINKGERIMRELDSAVTADLVSIKIRQQFDKEWIQRRIGLWLKNFYDHDFVFIADGKDNLIYALLGHSSVDPQWFNSILPELSPTGNYIRGYSGANPDRAIRITEASRGEEEPDRVALLQQFLGRPAIVAAIVVRPTGNTEVYDRKTAPIVFTVRFIDEDVLAEIATRLQLLNLHKAIPTLLKPDEHALDLSDDKGNLIGSFAWTPKRPGAEIVNSVIPFIAVALAGFALLVAMIYSYMRRTAATIATSEERLLHLALHDPLCGLPNRNYFGARLEAVIKDVKRKNGQAAVYYIDLDHFKDVNDTLGHPVGDELIRNVTLRLTRTLHELDLVARLGGDEFAVISTLATDAATLQATADGIIAALCAPYMINGHNIVIGASIGIAVIDRRSSDAADIMRYADMALYRAKNEGRNRACIYDAAMDAELSERKLLENELRRAIETDSLHLEYQPIVTSSGETIIGIEALARWNHPTRGPVPPAQFIPIAENSGLIIELGEWVLRRACLEAMAWPNLTVAVNVSPLQFRRLDFVEVVERILAETGLDPKRLELELTESTLLGNVDTAEVAMHLLKALGVNIALDDFGTGYSSLAYLRRFPFDKLKIDRSFVHSIERAPDAAAIVHAIVSLGRGLGMKVTAEGVETAEQHLFLRAAGVHCMQGFRFGKPGSATLIGARLAAPSRWRSIESDAAAMAL